MSKMWTKRKVFLFIFTTVTLFLSIFFLSIPILFLGLLLLLYLLVVPPPGKIKIHISREIESKLCFIGERPETSIELHNSTSSTRFVEVWDLMSRRIGVTSGTNGGIYSVRPRSSKSFRYRLFTPYRGDYVLGPVKMVHKDPLGLDVAEDDGTGVMFATLSVLPYKKNVSDVAARQMVPKMFPGNFLVKRVGDSSQFWSIRDYVKGDPYKAINWKASARYRRLLVNEHEKESTCDVIIVVDGRIVNAVGSIRESPFESAIRGGAGIASYLLNRGNDVGMVVYSSKVNIIMPKGGKGQEDTINAYLTKVLPSGNLPMKFAMDVARDYFPPRATVIIFSTLMYDPTILVTVRNLLSCGNRVIIFAQSSAEFESRMFYVVPKKARLVEMEHTILMEKLKDIGACVVSWGMREPIDVVLSKVSLS